MIADPALPLHAPGNCIDLTKTTVASEQIGADLCVQAGPDAKLYLNCVMDKGNPPSSSGG